MKGVDEIKDYSARQTNNQEEAATKEEFKSPTQKKSKNQKQKPGPGKFFYVNFNFLVIGMFIKTN